MTEKKPQTTHPHWFSMDSRIINHIFILAALLSLGLVTPVMATAPLTQDAPENPPETGPLSIEEMRRVCDTKIQEEVARVQAQIENELNIIRNNPSGSEVTRRAEGSLRNLGRVAVDRLVEEISKNGNNPNVSRACSRVISHHLSDSQEGSWKTGIRKQMHALLQGDNAATRVLALVCLENDDDPALVPDLLSMLDTGGFEGKSRAAKMLTRLDSMEAVAPLKKLLNDENYQLRKLAVTTLGKINPPGIGQDLLKHLDDPSTEVKFATYDALVDVADSDIRRSLQARLDRLAGGLDEITPDPIQLKEIERTLTTLGAIGDGEVINDLRDLLRKTTHLRVEQATENALLAIMGRVRKTGDRSMLAAIRPILKSNKSRLKKEALRVARDLKDGGALPDIYPILESGDQGLMKLSVQTIAAIADPSSRSKLRVMLRPGTPQSVVVEAAYALAKIGDYSGMDKVTAPSRQLLQRDRNNGDAMVELGNVYKRLEKHTEAINWYRKALKSSRIYNRSEVKYRLAATYSLQNQNLNNAKAHLQQSMAEGYKGKDPNLDPEFENLRNQFGPLTKETQYGGK